MKIQRLNKFFALPRGRKMLLLHALAVVCITRLGLLVLPFSVVRRRLRMQSTGTSRRQQGPQDEIGKALLATWAVRRAAAFVPGATCLTQALALQTLLGRHSIASVVRIGVVRKSPEEFASHAWLEYNGTILVGNGELNYYAYTPLVDVETTNP